MRDDRGHWYLLTGFVIGIVLGLVYAWLIAPQERPDTSPASLQPEFKDQFRAMIASAFVATGDLTRAEARLKYLGDSDITRVLSEQAQRTLGEGNSPLEAQALGLLAVALGQGDSAVISTPITSTTPDENQATINPGQATSTPPPVESPAVDFPTDTGLIPTPTNQESPETNAVLSTATPLPTRTPTATPGSPFVLSGHE